MERPVKIKVERERQFSAHHMLISAARWSLDDAQLKRAGSPGVLVAITLSALSIEAMCNAIGERVFQDWKDLEGAPPLVKLRLLCHALNIPFDKETEPWKSARWLIQVRNRIAHAKPEFVREEKIVLQSQHNDRLVSYPKSKLEKELTLGNARRAVQAADYIKDALCTKVPPENAFGLWNDGAFGRASLHEEAAVPRSKRRSGK